MDFAFNTFLSTKISRLKIRTVKICMFHGFISKYWVIIIKDLYVLLTNDKVATAFITPR